MDRRAFLEVLGAAALTPSLANACSGASGARTEAIVLPDPPSVSGRAATLTARIAEVDIGPRTATAWTLDGSTPGPTVRLRTGEAARITLRNDLPEPTILHWHGLDVPVSADGHPRLAIPAGATREYEFTVSDRAGTYWYHPHPHRRTAAQTYQGMAGFLVVEDDDEAALGLPSGERELLLLLQDKRMGPEPLAYAVGMGPDAMMGLLGDTGFANGVVRPSRTVARGRYRLRLLNGSNARVFDLGLTSGAPLVLIGTDGGLLETPTRLDRILLGPGERADVLADFSAASPGDRILLRSHAFEIPGGMAGMMGRMGGGMGRGMSGGGGGMGGMMGVAPQGAEMDLLELVVGEGRAETAPSLPERLSTVPTRAVDADTPRREFRFASMMMSHTINGRAFELGRVDERIPLGRTEVWSFVNESPFPHPVHVHGGQFRVVARSGGRGRVMPWETGLKDTVLVFPSERVDVAVRFARHPGIFLMHCHNLEHEDAGMMLNFEVVE